MNLPESLQERLAHWQLDRPLRVEPITGEQSPHDGARVEATAPARNAWPLPELAQVAILSEN